MLPQRLHIHDEAGVHQLVLATRRAAAELGLPPPRALQAATCASELATNILKYARRGTVTLERTEEGRGPWRHAGLCILAEDRGPGIADTALALRDHYSSGGTLGLGLPGVRRMGDRFTLESAPGRGTRVQVCLWSDRTRPAEEPASAPPAGLLLTGQHARPALGERQCGDRTLVRSGDGVVLLGLVDGLGHGPNAAASAAAAQRALEALDPAEAPAFLLERVHAALVPPQGVVAALMQVDLRQGSARCAGVGNVQMACLRQPQADDLHLPSVDGLLGARFRTPRESLVSLAAGDLLLLASDGLPALLDSAQVRAGAMEPERLARGLVERLGRAHDDAACVLGRWSA